MVQLTFTIGWAIGLLRLSVEVVQGVDSELKQLAVYFTLKYNL